MKGLVIGPDFALGRGRQGDAATLRALGQERGFTVEVLPPVMVGGRVVSSTAIREALVKGDLATASRLLGRPFSLSGKVTPGDERGRQLGFPTANMAANRVPVARASPLSSNTSSCTARPSITARTSLAV